MTRAHGRSPVEDRAVIKIAVDKHDIEQWTAEMNPREWNYRGFKKFESTVVTGTHRNQAVTIYFDRSSAIFGASLNGLSTTTRDYRALIKALGEIVRSREEMKFERFIEVDYDRTHRGRRTSIHGRSWGGFVTDDAESRPVVGIRFEFDVYDLSEPFVHNSRGGKMQARVWRLMVHDRKKHEWTIAIEDVAGCEVRCEDALIPFTEDRYRMLLEVQDGVEAIDGKLNAVFGDRVSAKRKAAQLDAFAGVKLLAPPTKGRKR